MANDTEVPLELLRVASASGAVRVHAEAGLDEVLVNGAPIVVEGSGATVDGRSSKLTVRVPEGLDLVIGTSSGRVEVHGRVGAVAVVTTSGKVAVDEAASVDIRTASGRVDVNASAGECRILGGSGRVTVGRCGPAHVTTDSGRITLRDVRGEVRAHCASGRIDIEMTTASDVDAETVSGRISIEMPAGAHVRVDTPSHATDDDRGEHDCVVTARSGSGRVAVR
jgi:DUF4097 and DUF4098 domain-containing protein YvlB